MEQRKPPNRTTVNLGAWVRPEVKERAETLAAKKGLTLGAFVAARIDGAGSRSEDESNFEGSRPAAHASDLALAAHRIVVTLDALRKRASEGGDVTGAVAELVALRKDVTAALIPLSQAYDKNLDERRVRDEWSG